MTKSLPLMILTAAALVSGVAGAATRTVPATAKPRPAAVTAAPAMKPAATKHVVATTTHTVAPGARMVSTKTSTGKAVTYNCAKAGNATKKACK